MKQKTNKLSTRLLSLLLSVVMVITIMPFTPIIEAQAASYSSNYQQWSQNKSDYKWMQNYGCGVVACSKLIYESGINNTASFNPDVFYKWCLNNNFINDNGWIKDSSGASAVIAYAKSRNITVKNWGTVGGFGNNNSTCKNRIKDNANKGYYSIIRRWTVKGVNSDSHYFLANNKKTTSTGDVYIYDSYGKTNKTPNSIIKNSYTMSYVTTISVASNQNFISQNDTPESRTNTTNVINAKLNKSAAVQEWRYYYSTNKSEVENHKSVYKTVLAYTKNGKSIQTLSTNVTDLTPNKTYYYVIAAKISDKWIYSKSFYGKTTNNKPSTAKVTLSSAKDIGIGDTVAVSWGASSYADSYSIKVLDSSNKQVGNVINNIKSTAYAIPASYFSKADTYSINVTANNSFGSTALTGNPTVVVHNNVSYKFVDSINGEIIDEGTVPYGHTPTVPVVPTEVGYTFTKWDKAYSNLKEDTEINALYEKNVYTVKFVDSDTGKILKTERVEHGGIAAPPEKVDTASGYVLNGWDKEYTNITDNTTINTVFKWYNADYPAVSTITAVEQDKENDNGTEINGYKVSITVKNGTASSIKKGRLVVALKSKNGYLLTETESSAFTLKVNEEKSVDVFVPFEDFAYKAEVFTINEYKNSGAIASPVSMEIDNSNKWSDWIAYTDDSQLPKKDVNGVSAVETKTETTSDITQYRYRTKSTTTSYATSMSGWTQNGYNLVKASNGTIDYVASWPSGFSKNHTYYKNYNKSPKTASESSTAKTTVSTSTVGYLYWHWSYPLSGSHSEGNRLISDKYNEFISGCGNTTVFEAFKSNTALKWDSSKKVYKATGHSTYSYWWLSWSCSSSTQLPVKRCTWTTYNKQYNYYKWSDWSDWTTNVQSGSDTKQVETREIRGTTTKYYRYKTSNSAANPVVKPNQIVNISEKVDTKYAGKEATVLIYKYDQPSDYTTEFAEKVIVGSKGEITVNNAILREAPTVDTGDYTISVSISGNSNMINIGTVEAPKPKYTVKFYDFDGKTVVKTFTDVPEGTSVDSPDGSKLNAGKGYKFSRWNQSSINVRDNLNIYPESEKEKYTIVFVDWGAKKVSMQQLEYGEEIIPPMAEEPDAGKTVEWDMSGATSVKNSDGGADTYIATKNTVISTVYSDIEYTINFINPSNVSATEDMDNINPELTTETVDKKDILSVETVKYEEIVDIPIEAVENEDYLFYGWINLETGELLTDTSITQSATYYPIYEFSESTEIPVASVSTGEYKSAQTVNLSCETSNAVIYYTTDGSDPKTSSTAIEYTKPITLTKSCVLKFYATALGKNSSLIASELYAINTNTSGAAYHIVTVYLNQNMYESERIYQGLVRDSRYFDDSEFSNDVEGYTYGGLYYDTDFTKQFYADEELVSKSLDLFAKYTPKKVTITFKNYDGSVIKTVNHVYGENDVVTPTPTRKGYVFLGWGVDDFTYISSSRTVTAKYCKEDEYATVSLNKKEINVIEGQVFTKLIATVSPANLSNSDLSWTSNDETVATVDENGVVTALSKGTVTITVTVDATGESANCEFIVSGDYNKSIVLGRNSYLKFDSEGYIRELKQNINTVNDLTYQFNNDFENLMFTSANGAKLTGNNLVGTGSIVKFIVDGNVLDTAVFIMTGDVNGDGYIGNADVSSLSQWFVDTKELTYEQQLAADVNGDGSVDNKDSAIIQRFIVGKAEI